MNELDKLRAKVASHLGRETPPTVKDEPNSTRWGKLQRALTAHITRWSKAVLEAGHTLCPCKAGAPHERGAAVFLDDLLPPNDIKSELWRRQVTLHVQAGGQVMLLDAEAAPDITHWARVNGVTIHKPSEGVSG